MSNKSEGSAFELELSRILADNKYWVHRFVPSANGQPADLIAIRDYIQVLLIDCKVCANNVFRFSRIEPNQRTAMEHWQNLTKRKAYFALKTDDGIFMWSYDRLIAMEQKGMSSFKASEISKYGLPLEDFL